MRLSGRPLLDNDANQALFVGREGQLRVIEEAFRSGLNCLVTGDPGSGKTSLVRAVMFGGRAGRFRFSYARAGTARSANDLLAAVLNAIPDGPGDLRLPATRLPTTRQRDVADLRPIELIDELAGVVADRQGSDPETQVIVVDDVPAVAGFEVFGALRDELWEVDALWLVTASTVAASGLIRPPADVFFESRAELGPLAAAEAAELLRRRTDDLGAAEQAELIAAALASAPQTPRRLLEVARELASLPAVGGAGLNTGRGLKARAAALEQVSRPARMLAAELDALGWVSASDERLLDRMGWTRPRVVQVIAELSSRGLVQMREENTGRGRPRKLYRLTPAVEFAGPEGSSQPAIPSEGAAPPRSAEPA